MFNLYFNQLSTIDWTTIIVSTFTAIIGALIAGYYTSKATKDAHKHNQELKADEIKLYEKATALSIVEELSVLKEEYEEELDSIFENVNKKEYSKTFYMITQDYTTIFTQNSGEIGLIKNKELRKLIIKCYTCLKKFIEFLLIYNNKLNSFDKSRVEFIKLVYPSFINVVCSEIDYDSEILKIKSMASQNNWTWLNSPYINQMQIISFLNNDDILIKNLIESSLDLKKRYNKLKQYIENIIELSNTLYKE